MELSTLPVDKYWYELDNGEGRHYLDALRIMMSDTIIHLPNSSALQPILAMNDQERCQALINSDAPASLVPLVPADELFWTLKAADDEQRVELLKYAAPEQVEFILDLEVWDKDRFSSNHMQMWFQCLAIAGGDTLAKWIKSADIEQLALALNDWITVYKRDESMDKMEAMEHMPSWTQDDTYYIDFKNKNMMSYCEALLRMLASQGMLTYHRLLEDLRHMIPSEVEEEAYRFRNIRLHEHGLPTQGEAMALYRYVTDKAWTLLSKRTSSSGTHVASAAPQGFELIQSTVMPSFLAKVLAHIEDTALMESIMLEFMRLANQIIAARNYRMEDRSIVHECLQEAERYVSIGLEYISKGDEARAVDVTQQHYIEHLFSLGFSQTLKPGMRLKRLEKNVTDLESPHSEHVEGLLERFPTLYNAEQLLFQPFENYAMVEAAFTIVDTL